MATSRVYILAKELGVKSSAIVEKCQSEDLDVKNHMSTISAGLAATIREWFSEGEHTTTVEVAEKVDLRKVRIKKKLKKKAKKTDVKPAEEIATEETAEEGELAEPSVDEAATLISEEESAIAEEEEKVIEIPPEPPVPEPIVPAGPMLEKPKPAKLSGPEVVRVESPEPEETHKPRRVRSRPRAKARYDEAVTEPLMPSAAGADLSKKTTETTDKSPSKRHKDRTHGRRHTEVAVEKAKKFKFETQRRQRDIEERRARLSAAGGEGMRLRPMRKIRSKTLAGDRAAMIRPEKVTVSEPITVKDLSATLAVKASEIVFKLMGQGIMASANQNIDADVAEMVSLEFGVELTVERKSRLEDLLKIEFEERTRKNLSRRPVVATMLGHVDHGKTSLLDKIRSTKVTDGEAGGITQHIGAYQVQVGEHKVTFLDTPGHAAFTAMRARGANMTDVVVLVVAADDGIMPQTVEVINHAKAAKVGVIVALNKIDLPGCDTNRIYSQLAEHNLIPIEWSGETDVVKTSAMTGEGIDDLLEHLDYMAELMELKADDTIPAMGWVVEAEMTAQRGVEATLLIKEGVLSKSNAVLAGSAFGRIKTLRDSNNKNIKVATSSMPVTITGLSEVPRAGDRFYCLGNDINRAKAIAEENKIQLRESSLARRTQITLDNLFNQIEAGNVKELNIIIRADVQGSIDVLTKYLSELSTEEVKIKILHAATGGITEGDVTLAEASNAIVIGFNVVSEDHVARIADNRGVEIRLYTIIYCITEDLERSMTGLLDPEQKEESIGRATVRNTFKVSKIGVVAGCFVADGFVKKDAKVRLIRDNIVVKDDLKIESLRHFKNDAREVKAGLECGIKLKNFDDVKIDDVFDFFEIVEIARTLR